MRLATGRVSRYFLAFSGLAIPSVARAQQTQQVALERYVVRPGDTCRAIAQREFGDPAQIDLIHQHNALGPPPHTLRPGQVLMLPRRAESPPSGPAARLTFVRNLVDAFTPEEHRGRANEPLSQGHRVSTQTASSAEVTFRDETQLQLGEHTLVVILGDTRDRTQRATASDTRLERGTLRAHLDQLAGTLPIATPAGLASLGRGESQLHVDESNATRLAVYHGRARLTASRAVVNVPEGYGSRANQGRPPTPPRLLPLAPVWVSAPARRAFAPPEGVTLSARYAPGTGPGPAVTRWHVQFARDERFNDLVVDARVPVGVTSWEARAVPPGTYFLRISGLDADPFEGRAGEVSRVDVAPLQARAAEPYLTELTPPPAMVCRVDDEPYGAVGAPARWSTVRPHRLRCASAPDSADVYETTIPAVVPEGLRAAVTLETTRQASANEPGAGRLHVSLRDGQDRPVPDLAPTLRLAHDMVASPLESDGAPGTFVASVTWPLARLSTPIEVLPLPDTVPDTVLDAGRVALYEAPPPPPVVTEAPEQWRDRVALRLEGSAGVLLSSPTQERDYDRSLGGAVRVGVPIARPLILQASGLLFALGADTLDARLGGGATLGLRVEPRLGRLARLVLDASGGIDLSNSAVNPMLETGAGVEFQIGRSFALGPIARYTRTFSGDDRQTLSLALSLSLTPWHP